MHEQHAISAESLRARINATSSQAGLASMAHMAVTLPAYTVHAAPACVPSTITATPR